MMDEKELFLKTEGDAYFERNTSKLTDDLNYISNGTRLVAQYIEENRKSFKFENGKGGDCKLLELGCCSGYNLRYLCNRFNLYGYGIEPSRKAVNYGISLMNSENSNIKLQVGTSDELPFDDESMDIILIGFCLFWVDRRYLMKTISEVDRIIKTGGIVVIEDFDTINPYKRDNIHNPQAYTFKMDYAKLFLANPQYQLAFMKSYSHESKEEFHKDIQERVSTKILYKDSVEHVYL